MISIRLYISIIAVAVFSLILSMDASAADLIWAEDFESYANGDRLDVGANPNNWRLETDQSIPMSWCCGSTVSGNTVFPHVSGGQAVSGGTNAAGISAIPTQDSGTVTLSYDAIYGGNPNNPGALSG